MQKSTESLPSNRSVSDPELQRMVQQVQDVLPDIPAPAILKDLGRSAPAKKTMYYRKIINLPVIEYD